MSSSPEQRADVAAWAHYYAPEPLKAKLLAVLADLEEAERVLALVAADTTAPDLAQDVEFLKAEKKAAAKEGVRQREQAYQAIDELCAALEDAWRRYIAGDAIAPESTMLRAAYAQALSLIPDLSGGRRRDVLAKLQEYRQRRRSQP